jgi:hypothetical protein
LAVPWSASHTGRDIVCNLRKHFGEVLGRRHDKAVGAWRPRDEMLYVLILQHAIAAVSPPVGGQCLRPHSLIELMYESRLNNLGLVHRGGRRRRRSHAARRMRLGLGRYEFDGAVPVAVGALCCRGRSRRVRRRCDVHRLAGGRGRHLNGWREYGDCSSGNWVLWSLGHDGRSDRTFSSGRH